LLAARCSYFSGGVLTRATGKGLVQSLMMAAIMFQASGGLGGFPFVILIMVAIMYFMVIMPQQRQRKKMQAMLGALKTGDKIITSGGIYGTINGIDGDSVILKISAEPQVKIRIARAAITQVEASENAK
jgi:preprotein translocase subunit YajC